MNFLYFWSSDESLPNWNIFLSMTSMYYGFLNKVKLTFNKNQYAFIYTLYIKLAQAMLVGIF